MSGRHTLDPALSVYIDVLRGLSALVVFVAHAFVMRFHDGDRHVISGFNFGLDAVMVFFVLSGFVVAHAAQNRSPGAFVFARASRLWSVAIPAVCLTFLLDRLGASLNPDAYVGVGYNELPFAMYLFYGITFANEWAPWREFVGINGPLWSLSYEAAYYMLFAIALYCRGPRRVVLLLCSGALFGLNVLLLFPAWLAGVAAYHLLQRDLQASRPTWLVLASLPPAAYVWAISYGHPTATREPFGDFGMSDHFLWNNIFALLVALHLIGVAKLIAGRTPKDTPFIRMLAGTSFSIYVVHVPVMHFGWAVTGLTGPAFMLIICPITLLFAFGFAQLFERPLPRFRDALRAGWRHMHTLSGPPYRTSNHH